MRRHTGDAMAWGRAILAVLATVFVIGGMASLVVMGGGVWRPDFVRGPEPAG